MAQNPIVTIEMENGDVMKAELYPEIKKCYKELLTFPQNNSALRIYYLNTFDNK